MKTYLKQTLIRATPMTSLEVLALGNCTVPPNTQPNAPGYLLETPANPSNPTNPTNPSQIQTSWEPKHTFEATHIETSVVSEFSFSMALESLKINRCVARHAYTENVYIQIQYPEPQSKITQPYLTVNFVYDTTINTWPWQPDQDDLFANDWYIVEMHNKD